MGRKIIDLTNKRFGILTVIERADDYIYPDGKSIKLNGFVSVIVGKKLLL